MRTLLISIVIAVILAVVVLYQFDKVPTDKVQNFVPASGVERLEKILKPGRVEKLEEMLKQGRNYYGRSEYKKAIEKWEAGFKLAAEDKKYQALFCLEMAKIYNELGHHNQVTNILNEANNSLNLWKPSNAEERTETEEMKVKVDIQWGILYRHLGQYNTAEKYFRDPTEDSLQDADILTQRGIMSHDKDGQLEKALSIYKELGYRRGEADILVEQSIILRDSKKPAPNQVELALALANFQRAIQPYHNNYFELGKSKAYAEIGRTSFQLKKSAEALTYFDKAWKIDTHAETDNWQSDSYRLFASQ